MAFIKRQVIITALKIQLTTICLYLLSKLCHTSHQPHNWMSSTNSCCHPASMFHRTVAPHCLHMQTSLTRLESALAHWGVELWNLEDPLDVLTYARSYTHTCIILDIWSRRSNERRKRFHSNAKAIFKQNKMSVELALKFQKIWIATLWIFRYTRVWILCQKRFFKDYKRILFFSSKYASALTLP